MLVSTDGLSDLVEGGFDVLVRTGRLDDRSLISRNLMDTRMVTAAAPGLLAEVETPNAPEALTELPCVRYMFPDRQRVFALPLERDGTGGGPITALYLPTRHLSPTVRSFVDFFSTDSDA